MIAHMPVEQAVITLEQSLQIQDQIAAMNHELESYKGVSFSARSRESAPLLQATQPLIDTSSQHLEQANFKFLSDGYSPSETSPDLSRSNPIVVNKVQPTFAP